MPQFKKKVWEKVTIMHQHMEEDRGEMGVKAGEIFKQRLQDRQKRDAAEETKCLD